MDYRSEQLNQAQQKLAEEEQKRFRILQRIREYDTFIEQAFLDQQQALSEPVLDAGRLQGFPNFIWRLKQSRFQEHQALQVQEQKLLGVREELKQALIKKKSLDILKEKDQARYRKKIEKAEEEFLAELALNRLSRQGAH
ncbi:MAG TPA: flagellar export protein FliJ [Coleofasciculaceae cyanobacterium]